MSVKDPVQYQHLYGPVPSRRLGRSLGVDIVPYKVCSYDCIYCQLGRTTRLTSTPEHLVSAEDIIREIQQWLELGGTADYITFAGSGEPTLNAELGKMIRATSKLTNIPLAVITNGSLLDEQAIRDAISLSDVVIPSLDAGTEYTFRKINRSAPDISFVGMREGLVQTAQEYPGQIWLEIMLVEGINDSDDELYAMREIVRRVCPEKLQINTVERPSKSGDARRVSEDTLIKAQEIFGEKAEIIVNHAVAPTDNQQWRELEEELISLLSRRPCTIGDIVAVSGHNVFEATKYLQRLQTRGLIEQIGENDPYYRIATSSLNSELNPSNAV